MCVSISVGAVCWGGGGGGVEAKETELGQHEARD